MENTADELTGLSILDYERKLLMLTRCGETKEPAAPLEKLMPLTSYRRAFPSGEEVSFDQHDFFVKS